MFGYGAFQSVWLAYNLFVEEQPEFTASRQGVPDALSSPGRGLLFGLLLMFFGVMLVVAACRRNP